MKTLLCVIGTRPQMIKHLPFQMNIDKDIFTIINLHTGQHYDDEMKNNLMNKMDNVHIDKELKVGSSDRESRLIEMTNYITQHIDSTMPDMIVVYGDTDSTLAGAYAAVDRGVPLCHIEAGLRSGNMDMPEEYNRIETDKRSQLLFCPSDTAVKNLKQENITEHVYMVGDIMKDAINLATSFVCNLKDYKYYYATLHRPYNVDNSDRLKYILNALNDLDEIVKLSLHPRTLQSMSDNKIMKNNYTNIDFIPPQTYLNNINYMIGSEAVITDSGGMQKEAYWLEKKCITIRSETEWKETLHDGCNTLIFNNLEGLYKIIKSNAGPWDSTLYGDGATAKKILSTINNYLIAS